MSHTSGVYTTEKESESAKDGKQPVTWKPVRTHVQARTHGVPSNLEPLHLRMDSLSIQPRPSKVFPGLRLLPLAALIHTQILREWFMKCDLLIND